MSLHDKINQYRKEQSLTQKELAEKLFIKNNVDNQRQKVNSLAKGTTVYFYDMDEDVIEQYEFDQIYENGSHGLYYNPEDHCWVTKNGKRRHFELNELHLTIASAEKERNDLMEELKEKFLKNGIIQFLFTEWLYADDSGLSALEIKVMKELIQEHYGIKVSEEMHS